MKQQFAAYGALMVEVRGALKAIWREQNKEIGIVNEEHRAMHDAYDRKEKDVAAVIKGFEIKLDEELSYSDMLDEQKKAMREIERLNEEFEENWGADLDVHEEKIAAIDAKYERMYQRTMKKAGFNLNADTDLGHKQKNSKKQRK